MSIAAIMMMTLAIVLVWGGLVVAMIVAVRLTAAGTNAPRAWTAVLVVTLAQGVIGYVQYFTGLPWLVVLLHMLGASLLVVAAQMPLTRAARRRPLRAVLPAGFVVMGLVNGASFASGRMFPDTPAGESGAAPSNPVHPVGAVAGRLSS